MQRVPDSAYGIIRKSYKSSGIDTIPEMGQKNKIPKPEMLFQV